MARAQYPATFWIAITASLLGSLQFGYQIGVLNPCLNAVTNELNYHEEGIISSAVVLGAAFGSITAGQIADTVGPRLAQILNIIPFLIGTVLCCWTPGNQMGFLVGRVVTGIGAGAASLYTPRYVAEIAPASLRGNLGTQHQVCINVGILLAYLAGWPYEKGFTTWHVLGRDVSWWRVMMALSFIPAAAQLMLMWISPETPVWLGSKKPRLALAARLQLWGSFNDHGPAASAADAEQPTEPLLPESQETSTPLGWGALARPEYRWMVLLAVGLPVLQQASGINTVIYYSSKVFTSAGLKSPILGSVLMGLVNVTFTIIAAHFMDHWGRRPLLLTSFFGMATCLIGVAATDHLHISHALQGALTVALVNLYVLAFALGAGPIPWLYISEILPPRIKGPAAALGTCVCWLGNLVVTMTFTPLLAALGIGGAYLLYALLNLGAVAFVMANVIETKKKTLAEIERELLLAADGGAVGGGGDSDDGAAAVEEGQAGAAVVVSAAGARPGKKRSPSLAQWRE